MYNLDAALTCLVNVAPSNMKEEDAFEEVSIFKPSEATWWKTMRQKVFEEEENGGGRNAEQGSDGWRRGEGNLFEFELWDVEDFLVWELFMCSSF